jgi:hypothetical protein
MARESTMPTTKERHIPKIEEYGGLCTNCNHSSTCSLRRQTDHPVWQCEEFDDYTPPMKSVPKSFPRKKHTATKSTAETKNPREYLGLCSNCGNLATCQFPKPEGGVWHCEEYI